MSSAFLPLIALPSTPTKSTSPSYFLLKVRGPLRSKSSLRPQLSDPNRIPLPVMLSPPHRPFFLSARSFEDPVIQWELTKGFPDVSLVVTASETPLGKQSPSCPRLWPGLRHSCSGLAAVMLSGLSSPAQAAVQSEAARQGSSGSDWVLPMVLAATVAFVLYDQAVQKGDSSTAYSSTTFKPAPVELNNFWTFGLQVYRESAVPLAKLEVRDKLDGNIIIFCCWAAVTGRHNLTDDDLQAAIKWGESIRNWKEKVRQQTMYGEREKDKVVWDGNDEYDDEEEDEPSPELPPATGIVAEVLYANGTRDVTRDVASATVARNLLQRYFAIKRVPVGRLQSQAASAVLKACFVGVDPTILQLDTIDPSEDMYEDEEEEAKARQRIMERDWSPVIPDIRPEDILKDIETRIAKGTAQPDLTLQGQEPKKPDPGSLNGTGNGNGNGFSKGSNGFSKDITISKDINLPEIDGQ